MTVAVTSLLMPKPTRTRASPPICLAFFRSASTTVPLETSQVSRRAVTIATSSKGQVGNWELYNEIGVSLGRGSYLVGDRRATVVVTQPRLSRRIRGR